MRLTNWLRTRRTLDARIAELEQDLKGAITTARIDTDTARAACAETMEIRDLIRDALEVIEKHPLAAKRILSLAFPSGEPPFLMPYRAIPEGWTPPEDPPSPSALDIIGGLLEDWDWTVRPAILVTPAFAELVETALRGKAKDFPDQHFSLGEFEAKPPVTVALYHENRGWVRMYHRDRLPNGGDVMLCDADMAPECRQILGVVP